MRPEWYKGDDRDIQPIDLVESQKLSFHEASIVKYVCRHRRKGGREDLEKAMWYLDRLIEITYGSEDSDYEEIEDDHEGFSIEDEDDRPVPTFTRDV